MFLALHAASDLDLKISKKTYKKAFAGAISWFDHVTSADTGRTGYQDAGDEGSLLTARGFENYPFSKKLPTMTAVACLCRILAGEDIDDEGFLKSLALLMKYSPKWQEQDEDTDRLSTINMYYWYYWYYASHALFQYGGRPWQHWRKAMEKTLVDAQRKKGDEKGSWDPIGEWGPAGGRVYSTAMGALTLQVYYRLPRVR